MTRLIVGLGAVAGADEHTPLVAVSRSGATATGTVVLGPDELIQAWRWCRLFPTRLILRMR